MAVLRNILMVFFVMIAAYSLAVIWQHGVGWFPIFWGDLMSVTWRGQFNLDFAFYLMVSALWLAWRSGFSTGGVAIALMASVLGMTVFAPVVLVLIARAKGDMHHLLLGAHVKSD